MPAVAHPLGPRQAIYTASPVSWHEIFLVYLPGALAVLASLATGYSIRNAALLRYGPVAADIWSRPWFLISALGLLDLLLLAFVRILRARGFVAVHKRGIELRLGSLRPRSLRWTEISGLVYGATQERFLGLARRKGYRAELVPNLGRPLRLDRRVEDVPGLVEHIKIALNPSLLTALQNDFQAGRWLHFGALRLHQGGLSLRGSHPRMKKANSPRSRAVNLHAVDPHAIPWQRVSALGVEAGDLVIELDHNNRLRLPVVSIPNLDILLQIVAWGINPKIGVNPTRETHAE